jgi:Helix-turn-helix domain
MRPGKRFGLSAIEKNDIWSRWKAGQTLHEIGRAFDKPHNSIRCVLLPRGGIPPIARRRSRLALTRSEREDISRGIASGSSLREMARHLDRAASRVAGRSHAMVAVPPIERMRRMTKPGSRPCGPRSAFLPCTGVCESANRTSLRVEENPACGRSSLAVSAVSSFVPV